MTENILQFACRIARRRHGDDAQPENALGNLRRTERGFEIITFHDRYNQACSLQQSSLAFEATIWLGIAGNRMHLTESQVMNLVERLNAWLLSGDRSFMLYGESVEDLQTQVEDKKEEPVIFPEFVNAPLWRRLWIALFPAKLLYSLPIE